jgi:hypothetical protein
MTRNKNVVIPRRMEYWIVVRIEGHFISTGASLNRFDIFRWVHVIVNIDNSHGFYSLLREMTAGMSTGGANS